MTPFEHKIFDTLVDNSFLFFRESLNRLMEKDSSADTVDVGLVTLTCAELQISLELVIRAILVQREGLKSVLKSDQQSLSEDRIIELYHSNGLKVTDFEQQKNLLKSRNLSRLTKEDFREIDRFQIYRNKIVHFSCDFPEEQLGELRDRLVYYIVHVVLVLMTDTTTGEEVSEFLQSKLGFERYKRLKDYPPYVKAMEQYAARNADTVWNCIGCSHRTYSPEMDFCFCCGYETLTGYSRVDCFMCGTKNSVIYDNLDIHNEGNHHQMPGRCLNCDEETFVFECPVCGEAHDTSSDQTGDYCREGHCVN